MSMLPLFVLLFLLHFLLHGANAKCAIGDADENAKWINSNGRLKIHDNDNTPDTDGDDYFLIQASCPENLDYDDMDEVCNCTFTNSTGFIFSCNGEYMDDLPNLGSEVPVDRLRLYAVRNARNVHQIKSYQFSGYRTKEIRIEYIEALHLEDRAFEGVLDLETLKLTHNNFGKIGQPELIFAGLVNLTTLDLSYNQLTGWKSRGKSPSDTPVLPKLTTLDLSGNPLEYLHNDTFEWLRGSQLQHLNLRKCNIKSVETGTDFSVFTWEET
ncbi:Relaxin receptor 2 [Zootermopsis nevadensis]|uniref:Relaxin receptor 2 n=1 Tax=Zootermopsis nevadensis TaxID=136037 RepID=A0A067R2X7_ZOONE|nr:Relaxin receptor 2 [Zootermopsis nevadensis]